MKRLAASILLLFAPAFSAESRQEPPPEDLEGVGITEHLNDRLPLDTPFIDSEGKSVRLSDYFNGDLPVVLNLGYYSCPMLCGLVLNGLLDGMKGVKWTPGVDYNVVTVSIDHTESTPLARLKKKAVIGDFGRPAAADGWYFLTGTEENIRRLTEAVGFGFKWNDDRKEYAHAAGVQICTPDGRLSRYLYGLLYEPNDLRMSLLEAAEGKIGSPMDQILMFCYYYDAEKGRYAPAARRIMSGGGAIAAIGLGITLIAFWRLDARRKSNRSAEEPVV